MTEQAISSIVLPSWIKAAARCGIDIKPIFQRHGIEVDLSRLDTRTLAPAALSRVLQECCERPGGEHFPFLVGEAFAFEYLPELEIYLSTSASLRDAARVFEWLPALVNPVLDARLEEDAHHARLVLYLPEDTPVAVRPRYVEAFFASILKFARGLTNRPDILALCVQSPPAAYADLYQRYFGLPVQFAQPRNEAVFLRAALDRPLEGALPDLHRQAAESIEHRVAALRTPGAVTARLQAILQRSPALLRGGIEAAAAAVDLSPRTLQRYLSAEGTCFAEVMDGVRYQWARTRLERGEDLEALAENLGFSDRRSFTRAFKRWSGQTPSAWRRAARPAAMGE